MKRVMGSYAIRAGMAAILLCVFARSAMSQDQQPSTWQQIQHTIVVGPSGPLLPAPLPDFHITGYFLNNSGWFVNASTMKKYTYYNFNTGKQSVNPWYLGHNDLSSERNNLQLDLNWDVNEDNHLYARFWGVYEPAYPIDYTGRHNPFPTPSPKVTLSGWGGFPSDYNNQYQPHEVWWKNRTGPLTLFVGQQIVTWGESIAFRVGDVINPQDVSWSFGFSNLEQSRKALWMVHPVLNLPKFGPFESNFLELIVVPALQPQWTEVAGQPHGGWGTNHDNTAGLLNTLFLSDPNPTQPELATFSRFSPRPYPYQFGFACGKKGIAAGVCVHPTSLQPFGNFLATDPRFIPTYNGGIEAPLNQFQVPEDTWSRTQVGVRYHTLVGDTEMTALYYYTNRTVPTYQVVGSVGKSNAAGLNVNSKGVVQPTALLGVFPHVNIVGLTANRPLYLNFLPSYLANLPLTLRGEGTVTDRVPFDTSNQDHISNIVYHPVMNSLMALDLDRAYVPMLSATGSLNGNFEVLLQSLIDGADNLCYSGVNCEHQRHNEPNFLLNIGDSWYWNAFGATFTGIYSPDGTTFTLFPSVLITPPWTDKYFFGMKYINVLGNDKFSSFGATSGYYKGKQMFLGSFQYNFNLM